MAIFQGRSAYTSLSLQQYDFSPPSVLNDPNDWSHTWGANQSDATLKAYLSELVLITAVEESMPAPITNKNGARVQTELGS